MPQTHKKVEENGVHSLQRKPLISWLISDFIAGPFSKLWSDMVNFTGGKATRIMDVATGTGKQAFACAKRGYEVAASIFRKAWSKGRIGATGNKK